MASFVGNVLIHGRAAKLTEYVSTEHYHQHNPAIADGLSGLGAALEAMAKAGVSMTYECTHKVLGEGNFVLTVSEGKFAGKHSSFYDLFRVEQGKIVEHWDVIESIPPRTEWRNANGKFCEAQRTCHHGLRNFSRVATVDHASSTTVCTSLPIADERKHCSAARERPACPLREVRRHDTALAAALRDGA